MRRWAFYLSVALLAFGIGSSFVFNFFRKNENPLVIDKSSLAIATEPTIPIYYPDRLPVITSKNVAKTEFVCNDKEIRPFWHQIMKDKFFPDYLQSSRSKIDCAKELKIKSTDLDINGDGVKEIVIQGIWGSDFCGMYSGCWFGIFEQNSRGYKPVYTYLNVAEFELGKGKNLGYRDLILRSDGGVYGEYVDILRFNGKNMNRRDALLKHLIISTKTISFKKERN